MGSLSFDPTAFDRLCAGGVGSAEVGEGSRWRSVERSSAPQALVCRMSRLGVVDMTAVLDVLPLGDYSLFAASGYNVRLVGMAQQQDREEGMRELVLLLLPAVLDALNDVCLEDFILSSDFASPRLVHEPLRVWHELWNELGRHVCGLTEQGDKAILGQTLTLLRSTLSDVYFFHFHQDLEIDELPMVMWHVNVSKPTRSAAPDFSSPEIPSEQRAGGGALRPSSGPGRSNMLSSCCVLCLEICCRS